MSDTDYDNGSQVWQNNETPIIPAVIDHAWNQQYRLQLRHAPGAHSVVEENPSSPGYEPFGPREGNLQDSLLNQTVQGPLRMIVRNARIPPQPGLQQQQEQYQQTQGQYPPGLESLITNANLAYHLPSQAQLEQWEREYQQSQILLCQFPAEFETSMPTPISTQPQLSGSQLRYLLNEYEVQLKKWEEEYQQAHGTVPEGLEALINDSILSEQVPLPEFQHAKDERQQAPDKTFGGLEGLVTDPALTFEPSEAQIQQWDEEFWQSLVQSQEGDEQLLPVSQFHQQSLAHDQQNFAPQSQSEVQFSTFGEASTSGYVSPYDPLHPQLPPQLFVQRQPELLPSQQLLHEQLPEVDQPVPLFSGQMSGDCKVQCPKCVLRFMNRPQLRVHDSLHDPRKPHVCHFLGCNSRFNDRLQLEVHISGHNGEVTCSHCGEFFLSTQALTWHNKG